MNIAEIDPIIAKILTFDISFRIFLDHQAATPEIDITANESRTWVEREESVTLPPQFFRIFNHGRSQTTDSISNFFIYQRTVLIECLFDVWNRYLFWNHPTMNPPSSNAHMVQSIITTLTAKGAD